MIIVHTQLLSTSLFFSCDKLSNIFTYVSETRWYAIVKSKYKYVYIKISDLVRISIHEVKPIVLPLRK